MKYRHGESPLVIKSTLLCVYGRYIAGQLRSRNYYRTSDQVEGSTLAVKNNVSEAQCAESGLDFIHKLKLAQKELYEADGIVCTLQGRDGIETYVRETFIDLCAELNRLLSASIFTATKNLTR